MHCKSCVNNIDECTSCYTVASSNYKILYEKKCENTCPDGLNSIFLISLNFIILV